MGCRGREGEVVNICYCTVYVRAFVNVAVVVLTCRFFSQGVSYLACVGWGAAAWYVLNLGLGLVFSLLGVLLYVAGCPAGDDWQS